MTNEQLFEDLKQYIDGRISQTEMSVGGRIDKLENRFDTLENRFDTLENRFDTLENGFDTLENRFDTLENRFDNLENRLDNVEREVGYLTIKVKQLNHEVTELKTITLDGFGAAASASGNMIDITDNHEKRITKLELGSKVKHPVVA